MTQNTPTPAPQLTPTVNTRAIPTIASNITKPTPAPQLTPTVNTRAIPTIASNITKTNSSSSAYTYCKYKSYPYYRF